MSTLNIAAIRARADAATEGPWKRGRLRWEDADGLYRTAGPAVVVPWNGSDRDAGDAEFIAHARTDVPALCDEVERLRAAPTVTDEMVERAASVILDCGDASCDCHDDRDLALIRAALEAALGVAE